MKQYGTKVSHYMKSCGNRAAHPLALAKITNFTMLCSVMWETISPVCSTGLLLTDVSLKELEFVWLHCEQTDRHFCCIFVKVAARGVFDVVMNQFAVTMVTTGDATSTRAKCVVLLSSTLLDSTLLLVSPQWRAQTR